MKRYLLAAVATAAIATPAVARDGQGYVGVEAGVAWVKSQSGDVDITYTPLDVPGGTPLLPAGQSFNNIFDLDSHMGYNIGMYGGYDFGVFRLEGEVDWMHANLDDLSVDSDFIDAINAIASPDLVDTNVNVDQATSALAFMLNGLVDFGDDDGFSFQAGLGAGWAKSKMVNDKDSAFAWQAILGVNYAVSPNVDIGLRYKYFSTGNLNFHDNTNSFTFLRLVTNVAGAPATQTVLADVDTDFSTKFKAHWRMSTQTSVRSSRRITCY